MQILDQGPTPDDIPLDDWASTADWLLQQLSGEHVRKKRRTLLKLAEAAYLNIGQANVFRRPDCGSKVSHYKWREVDPAYEEAYRFLVGDAGTPGLALRARERELDEDERLALSALAEARTRLRVATAPAVKVLEDALSAQDRFGPDWRSRISAANSILDRADTETASQARVNVSTVEDAIARIYGNDTHSDNRLPAGKQDDQLTQLLADAAAQTDHDARHDGHQNNHTQDQAQPHLVHQVNQPTNTPHDTHDNQITNNSPTTNTPLMNLSQLFPRKKNNPAGSEGDTGDHEHPDEAGRSRTQQPENSESSKPR